VVVSASRFRAGEKVVGFGLGKGAESESLL
jgi:hypothetical protein